MAGDLGQGPGAPLPFARILVPRSPAFKGTQTLLLWGWNRVWEIRASACCEWSPIKFRGLTPGRMDLVFLASLRTRESLSVCQRIIFALFFPMARRSIGSQAHLSLPSARQYGEFICTSLF